MSPAVRVSIICGAFFQSFGKTHEMEWKAAALQSRVMFRGVRFSLFPNWSERASWQRAKRELPSLGSFSPPFQLMDVIFPAVAPFVLFISFRWPSPLCTTQDITGARVTACSKTCRGSDRRVGNLATSCVGFVLQCCEVSIYMTDRTE